MQNNEHFEFLFLLIRYIEYKQQHFQLERQTIINFNSTDYEGFKNYFVRDNVRLFVTILENCFNLFTVLSHRPNEIKRVVHYGVKIIHCKFNPFHIVSNNFSRQIFLDQL